MEQVAQGASRLLDLQSLQEEQASRVQELVRDAIKLYHHRGYGGCIEISSRLLTISESATATVSKPERAPWESEATVDVSEIIWARSATDRHVKEFTHRQLFDTLLARLERRARGWADGAVASDEQLDPLLGASTSLAFGLLYVFRVSISLRCTLPLVLVPATRGSKPAPPCWPPAQPVRRHDQ